MEQVLFIIAFPLIVALIISVAAAGREMNKIKNDSEKVYFEHLYRISSDLINADRDLYQAMLAATEYRSTLKEESLSAEAIASAKAMPGDYHDNSEQAINGVRTVAELAKTDSDIWTKTKAEGNDATFEQLAQAFEDNFAKWQASYDIEAQEGDWEEFNALFLTTREDISTMSDITEVWATAEKNRLEKGITKTITQMIVIFAIVIIALLVLAFLVSRILKKSMDHIEGGIAKLASGDFVHQVRADSFIRELDEIADALENMRKKLQESLLSVIGHANNVDETANETEEMIESSLRMTGDINNAVADLANGATSMAQDVMETSNVTIDMGDSVEQVMDSARTNLETGRTVYENSEKVQGQLSELRDAGAHTDRVADEVASSVNQTAEMVEQISKAAEAIISIASQTNLLSLNASIEAARAGEAGKGFAVVANEIKELAEDSNNTAKEITDMLGNITALSESNRKLTDEIKEATSNEAAVLQEMITSFDEMLSLLRETEEGNQNIMSLVENLNTNKGSILSSVESLSAISEENAASTQETSASLEQLNGNMSNVADQASSLKIIANELQANVAYFTVKES